MKPLSILSVLGGKIENDLNFSLFTAGFMKLSSQNCIPFCFKLLKYWVSSKKILEKLPLPYYNIYNIVNEV